MPDQQIDVFISYSGRDRKWVKRWLLPRLRKARIRFLIDYADFRTGFPLLEEIERAVLQSQKTLLVLTPDYLTSAWTELESLFIQYRDIVTKEHRLIPIVLKPCEPPLHIRSLIYMDFTKRSQWDSALRRLISEIKSDDKLDLQSSSKLRSVVGLSLKHVRKSEKPSSTIGSVARVTLRMEGDARKLSYAERENFVLSLAQIANVRPQQIRFLGVAEVGQHVKLEMPDRVARLLLAMDVNGDKVFRSLHAERIVRFVLVPKKYSA